MPRGSSTQTWLVHVARDRVQLGPIALGRADRFEPVRAAFEDVRDAAERLDVVHNRRFAKGALDGRERRLDAGPAALAFEALDEAGLLAADVGSRAAVNPDVQVVARAVDVLAQVAGGAGLLDRRLEDPVGPDILETKVDVGGARPGGEARDQDALEQLVGIPLHQEAVVEGRRLALVGVDAHERFFPILGKKRPLQAAREAGAAAAAELGILDQVDDRVGRHGGEGLAGRLVAAARFINLQRMAVGDVPVAAQDGFKCGHVSFLAGIRLGVE